MCVVTSWDTRRTNAAKRGPLDSRFNANAAQIPDKRGECCAGPICRDAELLADRLRCNCTKWRQGRGSGGHATVLPEHFFGRFAEKANENPNLDKGDRELGATSQ